MIQRKQTLYLIAALVATLVCLFAPIGKIELKGMGISPVLYNIALKGSDGALNFSCFPLFAFLALTCLMAAFAIFLYKNRPLQARLCTWCIVFDLAWGVYLMFCIFNLFAALGTLHVTATAFLPAVSLLCFVLARRGIVADEKLVRAADRIR